MKSDLSKNHKKGISIIEVVVALFILSLVIIPMNRLMSGSVKISKATDNIFKVTNLASSYMESILNIPAQKLKIVKRVHTLKINTPYSLKELELVKTDEKIKRYLTVEKAHLEGNKQAYLIIVEIEEKKKKVFSLSTIRF